MEAKAFPTSGESKVSPYELEVRVRRVEVYPDKTEVEYVVILDREIRRDEEGEPLAGKNWREEVNLTYRPGEETNEAASLAADLQEVVDSRVAEASSAFPGHEVHVNYLAFLRWFRRVRIPEEEDP